MELRHLRYFQAVAELGSLTRASEKLFIAQPPLSLQIRQLEEEIGTPLFERHARGVSLTAAGTLFLASAQSILEQVERSKHQARRVGEGVGGQVSIGFVPSASHVVIPRLVRELRSAYPDVEIDVQEMITAHQMDALAADRIDLGLARLPLRDLRVEIACEVVDPFCLAMPQDHPLSKLPGPVPIKQMAGEPLVAFTRFRAPAFFDQALNVCLSAGFSPRLRYEASTIFSLLDLVSAGLGLAIVPSTCALLPTAGVVFRPLPPTVKKGSLALVRRRGTHDAAVEAATVIVRRIFRSLQQEARARLREQGFAA